MEGPYANRGTNSGVYEPKGEPLVTNLPKEFMAPTCPSSSQIYASPPETVSETDILYKETNTYIKGYIFVVSDSTKKLLQ